MGVFWKPNAEKILIISAFIVMHFIEKRTYLECIEQ
jgi:hypothetical protein